MKTLLLAFLLGAITPALADLDMSGPSVGSSGIGVGKSGDGTFKFVDTKTQKILGDLGLGDLKDAEVHASWNKSGTRVGVLVVAGSKRMLRLYEKSANGMMTEIKFATPDPVAVCEAKNKKPFAERANFGSDCSDLGMWTDDGTAWFLAGVTKEVQANGAAAPISTVTLMVTFSVKVQRGAAAVVAVESVIGPLKDNLANDRRNEFLQNWEQRNALSDSVLQ